MAKKIGATAFIRANPNATYEEFFKATGKGKQLFWTTRNAIKRRNAKMKAKDVDLGYTPVTNLSAYHEKKIKELDLEIQSLHVVISYLETKLGIRDAA